MLTLWEKYDTAFLTHLVRKLSPSDKRFVTSCLYFPDNQPILGSLDRAYPVIASDIKIILRDLSNNADVLVKMLALFEERLLYLFSC